MLQELAHTRSELMYLVTCYIPDRYNVREQQHKSKHISVPRTTESFETHHNHGQSQNSSK
jgi:hypothetical protein